MCTPKLPDSCPVGTFRTQLGSKGNKSGKS
jgi:hypothetical protein